MGIGDEPFGLECGENRQVEFLGEGGDRLHMESGAVAHDDDRAVRIADPRDRSGKDLGRRTGLQVGDTFGIGDFLYRVG